MSAWASPPALSGPKCRGKTTSTGNGSAPVPSQKPQPTLAAVKEHRSRATQRTLVIPVAGPPSKKEWGQFGPSFDVPSNVAAKKGGLGNERTHPVAPQGGSTVGGVRRRTTSPGCGEQHGSEVSRLRRRAPRQGKVGARQSLDAPEGFRVATAVRHQTLRGSSDSGLG